jgi:hypothetical protein
LRRKSIVAASETLQNIMLVSVGTEAGQPQFYPAKHRIIP